MTSKDNIIYYIITAVVFVGIVLCCTWFHTSGQSITTGGSTNAEKQSMVDILNPYAPIVGALSTFVSTIMIIISTWFVIWTSCFRKTRREIVDDLKFEIHFLLSEEGIIGMNTGDIDEFLEQLEPKFQKEKYKKLHRFAFKELENEGIVTTAVY